MKYAMKHRVLCSMSFVMRICVCVIFLCFGAVLFCACKSGTDAGTDTSLDGQPLTRKGYNPQMDFAYDEHEDVDIDENYVGSLCGEAARELETMFGPAEFYVTAESNEDGSYIVNVYYNEKAVSFSDDELEQIRMYINQEYKEVRLSEINIQGW